MGKPSFNSSQTIFSVFFTVGLLGSGIIDPSVVMPQMLEAETAQELEEMVAEKTTRPPYTYKVGSRRDPFAPVQYSKSTNNSPNTPLSAPREEEGSIALLGLISGKKGTQALLKLPNGEHRIVGPGSHLKILQGAVERITSNSVIIARPVDEQGLPGVFELTLSTSP